MAFFEGSHRLGRRYGALHPAQLKELAEEYFSEP